MGPLTGLRAALVSCLTHARCMHYLCKYTFNVIKEYCYNEYKYACPKNIILNHNALCVYCTNKIYLLHCTGKYLNAWILMHF